MAASPFAARRRRALEAAADLLEELGADQEQPVDVFGAIHSLGLWLVFQPLRNLLGAIMPNGSGGIMLTTQRQPPVQRYTAGHEIGHWLLDQDRLACDTEDDVFRPAGERERVAQLFASYFLMPPPLAYAACARYGVRQDAEVRPAQAYLVARDMRVSYEAAVRQLNNLQVLTDLQRRSLLDVPPLRAKQELTGGYRPVHGHADVWPVDDRSLHHELEVLPDDEIIIDLPENRTTGYRWLDDSALRARNHRQRRAAPPPGPPAAAAAQEHSAGEHARTKAAVSAALSLLPPSNASGLGIAQPDDTGRAGPLIVVADEYQPGWPAPHTTLDAPAVRRRIAGDISAPVHPTADPAHGDDAAGSPVPRVGATGRRQLAVQAAAEGSWTYVLRYAALHDPTANPAATFTVAAIVHPTPAEQNRRALLAVPLGGDQPPSPPETTA